MSPPKSDSGPYRKPRADVYTLLLFFALVAIILACVCLWAEMQDYSTPSQKPWQGAPSVLYQAPGAWQAPAFAWSDTSEEAWATNGNC